MHAQLGGLLDDLNLDFTGGLDFGDWFGTPSATPTVPTPSAPMNNLQFLTTAVVTYLRERDLNKLNRQLVENGRSPVSAAQASYMADQYRLNGSIALPGQSSIMTWLPWIVVAGVLVYLVKK